jgi:hypothetical protein
MTTSAQFARERAVQLFAMSLEASQDGGLELADVLADAASKYLDRAEELETAQASPLRHHAD